MKESFLIKKKDLKKKEIDEKMTKQIDENNKMFENLEKMTESDIRKLYEKNVKKCILKNI